MKKSASSKDLGTKRTAIGARQFLETYATSILLKFCVLAQGVILARVLGVEGRGEYAAIILWPTIIANIGNFGTGLATTRASAVALGNVGIVTRTGILVSIFLSIISVGIGLAILPSLIPTANSVVAELAQLYMIFFVPAFILSANLAGVDQGQGNLRRLNVFRLLQSPINVGILLVLVFSASANLTYCLWALIASTWVITLGRILLLIREQPIWGKITSPVRLLREGLPYVAITVLGQLTHRGDRILLIWLLSERDLGIYAVAYSAASVLASMAQSMGFVILTISAQEKVGEGFNRVAQIYRGTLILSVLVGFVQMVAAYILLPIVYGSDFSDARLIGIILGWGVVLLGSVSVLTQAMLGQGKPLVGIAPNLLGLVAMILVSYALVPTFGLVGVAVAFVVAQAARTLGWMLTVVRHYSSAALSDLVPTAQDSKIVFQRLFELVVLFSANARNRLFTRSR